MSARLLRVAPAIVYVFACSLVAWPLLAEGFPRGHDWIYELVRAAQYGHALGEGQWIPAWAPDLYGGFGSPIFVFYAPAFSALTVAARGLLPTFSSAASLVLILLLVVSLISMRALVRAALPTGEPLAGSAARVAAIFYALHPYLLGDALLRNADAEYAGLALAPLPVAGVLLALRRPRAGFALVAFGLAAVVLSHNLTALVAAAAVVLAAAVRFVPERRWRPLALVGLAAALALGMTAFFWLPALAMVDLVRTEDLLTGKFDFHRQFPSLAELFGHARFYGAGWLTPLALLAAAAASWRAARHDDAAERRLLRAAVLAALAAIGLALRPSTWIWESLPLLPLFQFPWRWLGPAALASGLALGLAWVRALRGLERRRVLGLEALALLLVVLNALPHLQAYRPLGPDLHTGLEASLEPAALRRAGHRATVRDEYLPRGAVASLWQRRADAGPVLRPPPGATVRVVADVGSEVRLEVDATRLTRVDLARWAFPGWSLTLDGVPLAAAPVRLGVLAAAVPPGEHRLVARYRSPPLRRASVPLSAAALALAVGLLLAAPRRLFGPEPQADEIDG